jgi:hypothetical protein
MNGAASMLDIITTWLELAGLILLAVAAGLRVSYWSLPAGLAAGGAVLILEAAFIGWRSTPKAEVLGDESA